MTPVPCPSPRKILVVRGGAIGDFIITLPVLAALRRNYPAAKLEILGYKPIATLALAGGLADEVHSIEAREFTPCFSPSAIPSDYASSFFRQFDLILSFLFDPDRIFQHQVQACSQARFIQGPHRPDEAGVQHSTEVMLHPLEELGIAAANPIPELKIPGETASSSPLRQSGPIAMHPGSGGNKKNWPQAQWQALLTELAKKREGHYMLIGGEAEEERVDILAGLLPPNRTTICRNLPLVDLAIQMQQCRFYVGHDSGITHLAAALGLPGIALWGPTNEKVWRPRNPRFTVLKSPAGLSGITVEDVIRAMDSQGQANQPE